MRGDVVRRQIAQVRLVFQFTPLREGRPVADIIAERKEYFNSRPCVRGDRGRLRFEAEDGISIHAPA